MTLYDIIMGKSDKNKRRFTLDDWRALGRGDISDESIIEEMLAEGYEGMEDDD